MNRPPVHFDQAPVAEVACGVMFTPVGLKSVHLGLLWQHYAEEFPRVEEAAPVAKMIEPEANGFEGPQVNFNILPLPELRRNWFITPSGGALIQVQEDRFLFNWKRTDGASAYPRYAKVIAEFEKHLASFARFLKEAGLAEISYQQFELTYINIVGEQNGLKAVGPNYILADHIRKGGERFLPEPESVNWTTNYLLPDGAGRLHVTAQTATLLSSKEKVLRYELCARGRMGDTSDTGRRAWFNLAHEWITQGFADSTTEPAHALWKRMP